MVLCVTTAFEKCPGKLTDGRSWRQRKCPLFTNLSVEYSVCTDLYRVHAELHASESLIVRINTVYTYRKGKENVFQGEGERVLRGRRTCSKGKEDVFQREGERVPRGRRTCSKGKENVFEREGERAPRGRRTCSKGKENVLQGEGERVPRGRRRCS
jgi:hypothetical protein